MWTWGQGLIQSEETCCRRRQNRARVLMDGADCLDPYRRPARRTQWIVSTLAYHYGLDRGVENEIIVLATGLDQYLQEIFHHLDYQGAGTIPVEDFTVLCEVLGLGTDPEEPGTSELTFRRFHAKLCGFFTSRAGCQYESDRLLVGGESRHIETQIRLRSPLRRREKLVSAGPEERDSWSRQGHGEAAEERIAKLEDENASLRELIEDMRAALQSSDARCLALQVGLWKSLSKQKTEKACFSPHSSLRSLQNVLHEIELLEVQEAMLRNQRLEQDLWSSKAVMAALEDCNRSLAREQACMKRKVEDARQALLTGLSKVKDLEVKASHVPALQRHILQLESELVYYRSEVSKRRFSSSTGSEQQPCVSSRDSQHDRRSPTGRAMMTPDKMEEQLFRSVEGQAASDEEEDKLTGDQQRQVDEVKRILTRLSYCSERCDGRAFNKLMCNFDSLRSEESHSAVLELLERVTKLQKKLELKESQAEMDMDQVKDFLMQELQQRAEETKLIHTELQMLETERVRLSLIKEKLVDILQLLQQLRDVDNLTFVDPVWSVLEPRLEDKLPTCLPVPVCLPERNTYLLPPGETANRLLGNTYLLYSPPCCGLLFAP
ncbi:EF-hand and coiled-coil domain-containing protein 1 isoform X2 [Kryptolebias marmoratus]|nr:EF-hand and coiled-coil domain-containing protein 1 isoform X2 [Kryptolebias marmoratus]